MNDARTAKGTTRAKIVNEARGRGEVNNNNKQLVSDPVIYIILGRAESASPAEKIFTPSICARSMRVATSRRSRQILQTMLRLIAHTDTVPKLKSAVQLRYEVKKKACVFAGLF